MERLFAAVVVALALSVGLGAQTPPPYTWVDWSKPLSDTWTVEELYTGDPIQIDIGAFALAYGRQLGSGWRYTEVLGNMAELWPVRMCHIENRRTLSHIPPILDCPIDGFWWAFLTHLWPIQADGVYFVHVPITAQGCTTNAIIGLRHVEAYEGYQFPQGPPRVKVLVWKGQQILEWVYTCWSEAQLLDAVYSAPVRQ